MEKGMGFYTVIEISRDPVGLYQPVVSRSTFVTDRDNEEAQLAIA